METFNNENDQVDALKRLCRKRQSAGGRGDFRDWRAGWLALLDLPSAGYRQRRVAGLRKATSALKSNTPEVLSGAEKFAADNKIPTAPSPLELAQHFVEQNDLPNAEKQLQQGLAAASDDNLKSVISMRLARVQLQ